MKALVLALALVAGVSFSTSAFAHEGDAHEANAAMPEDTTAAPATEEKKEAAAPAAKPAKKAKKGNKKK